jgi:hypothetical protein
MKIKFLSNRVTGSTTVSCASHDTTSTTTLPAQISTTNIATHKPITKWRVLKTMYLHHHYHAGPL